MKNDLSRRDFIKTAAAVGAVHIVPRHVLGKGFVPPSDKITLAHIGCGSEGIRELPPLLVSQDIQIVSVCDPNRDSHDYVDWSPNGLKELIRMMMDEPNWREGEEGIPGGREVMREVVETYYAKNRASENYSGVTAYADFREMFARESDIDAVKIMTPDHHHATIAIAAMNAGKHVIVHKPLANRMSESRKVIETARRTGVATYFMPWGSNGSMEPVMRWINDGVIGTLRSIHNWTNRPVWPQYLEIPKDTPPIPDGFDWDLWLGPATYRPYHPHYTHNVFRGWYDFGGGTMADMGHYSLWVVLKALDLGIPVSAEATPSTFAVIENQVSRQVANDWSFPLACTVRFKYAARGSRPPVDLFFYDGGMRPPTPDELEEDNENMPREGMMFVGDSGKILSGFQLQRPRIIPAAKMEAVEGPQPQEEASPYGQRGQRQQGEMVGGLPAYFSRLMPGEAEFIEACRGGEPGPGNFLDATAISETANLFGVALRARRKILYDAEKMEITNVPEANAYLTREYREGWEL